MALVTEEARVEQERRRQELENRMERFIRSAPEDVLEILEALVAATQANEEARRNPSFGNGVATGEEPRLTCFIGGLLDEPGPDLRPADRQACGGVTRRMELKSKIKAKYWNRELRLSVMDVLAGDDK